MVFRPKKNIVKPKVIIYIILVFTLFMLSLSDIPGVSPAIRYLNDALVAVMCVFLFLQKDLCARVKRAGIRWMLLAMLLYSAVNFATALGNHVSLPLVVWAVRNTYRFLLFWLACVIFLEKTDLETIFDLLYKVQWVNLLLVVYQFFVLDLMHDELGGIFGFGGNSGLLIFSILLVSHATAKYLAGEFSDARF